MSSRKAPGRGKGRIPLLAGLLVLQALCAVFFIADVVGDFARSGLQPHLAFEAVVAVALAVGVILAGGEMRRTLEQSRRAEAAASAAAGAFAELVADRFQSWSLTAAESEVAFLALKGFDVGEIAEIRGAAGGTVRAQLARVYAKAGVSNRAQLLSLFIDDLLDGPVRASQG